MAQEQPVVQVSRLLDESGLGAFQIRLLVWSLFLVLIDGYDIAAIAFAAPSLVRVWSLSPGELAPVLTASLVGILFGSAIFGWVGDRYGRKAALVTGNLLFGVFTFAAAYSGNLQQMFWLRLLAGIGIGGVIPNVVAINAESAPRHLRATLAIIAVGCVPIGGAIPGFVAATLVPQYGWPILFQRRHCAGRHCDCGHVWDAGVDKIHDAASAQPSGDGGARCRDPACFQRAC